jgi:uncharacterized protein (DUF1800 family)
MADRRREPPPRTGAARPGRSGTPTVTYGGPDPADLSAAQAPLLDLIFPNRRPDASRRLEPSSAQLDRAAGFGLPDHTAHRRPSRLARLLGRRAKVTRALPGLADRPLRRRRILLGLGTGVVVASGAGAAATVITGAFSGAGAADRPDTSDGLGAAGLADSPAAAAGIAARATPAWPTPLSRDPVLHLLRRATFGPTLIDVAAMRQMGIDAWLERQLSPQTFADPVGDAVPTIYPTQGLDTGQLRATVKDGDYLPMFELGQATLARQMWSSRQLYEVMVDFWANHLNVVNPMDGGWDIRSPYDTEVIRRHALGRFAEMLHDSARHPAMLRYLNNDQSDRHSVNENYGRELLELHTVGIDAGYTETDVRQSAYIMTGRTIDDQSRFVYQPERHWTRPVKVLGFSHPNNKASQGLDVGDLYVEYLARHPATAHRIAFKLARRFVCDDPPRTLVDRLTESYLDSGTAVVPMLRTLFSSVEFWMSSGLKTRRPLENIVATSRILGITPGTKTAQGIEGLYYMANQMGQAPLNWSPPDGYADYADAWGSAHATLGTWNSHRALVQGWHEGITYPPPESLVGPRPATVGAYLDTLSARLVLQPMQPAHRAALLQFLGAKGSTKVPNLRLNGKVDHLVPLVLDSVYHALR